LTLVLAIRNDSGVVLAADGLGTYGQTIGSQQLPARKLAVIGDRCAVGQVGHPTVTGAMLGALQQSELASQPTMSKPSDEWLEIARASVANWRNQYLANAGINWNIPLQSQLPDALLVVAGIASDSTFSFSIHVNGFHFVADTPNYLAQGSGAVFARNYLDAYSYFDLARHPVLTLKALAARVMSRVSATQVEIGGEISLIAIHREQSAENPTPCQELTLDDPATQAAIQHWELAEADLEASLRVFVPAQGQGGEAGP